MGLNPLDSAHPLKLLSGITENSPWHKDNLSIFHRRICLIVLTSRYFSDIENHSNVSFNSIFLLSFIFDNHQCFSRGAFVLKLCDPDFTKICFEILEYHWINFDSSSDAFSSLMLIFLFRLKRLRATEYLK